MLNCIKHLTWYFSCKNVTPGVVVSVSEASVIISVCVQLIYYILSIPGRIGLDYMRDTTL